MHGRSTREADKKDAPVVRRRPLGPGLGEYTVPASQTFLCDSTVPAVQFDTWDDVIGLTKPLR